MEFSQERNDALNFLQAHPLGTLATLNKEGVPELAAIYFFVEPDFTTYFVTKAQTRKFQNTQLHHSASLISYDEETLMNVELQGEVEHVLDAQSIVHAIEAFQEIALSRKARYWIPPISQLDAGAYVVCKLSPYTVHTCTYATESDSPQIAQQLSFKP